MTKLTAADWKRLRNLLVRATWTADNTEDAETFVSALDLACEYPRGAAIAKAEGR